MLISHPISVGAAEALVWYLNNFYPTIPFFMGPPRVQNRAPQQGFLNGTSLA